MVVLTAETCWALNEYWINNKISGIKLVSLYSTGRVFYCTDYSSNLRKDKTVFSEKKIRPRIRQNSILIALRTFYVYMKTTVQIMSPSFINESKSNGYKKMGQKAERLWHQNIGYLISDSLAWETRKVRVFTGNSQLSICHLPQDQHKNSLPQRSGNARHASKLRTRRGHPSSRYTYHSVQKSQMENEAVRPVTMAT